mmetsp:Transcript_49336/g.124052  ORF Transcript_49336/g.124052 Transcript_49336/m.124052 type:complete len:233 (+) Transcript_49336:106-804(+)
MLLEEGGWRNDTDLPGMYPPFGRKQTRCFAVGLQVHPVGGIERFDQESGTLMSVDSIRRVQVRAVVDAVQLRQIEQSKVLDDHHVEQTVAHVGLWNGLHATALVATVAGHQHVDGGLDPVGTLVEAVAQAAVLPAQRGGDGVVEEGDPAAQPLDRRVVDCMADRTSDPHSGHVQPVAHCAPRRRSVHERSAAHRAEITLHRNTRSNQVKNLSVRYRVVWIESAGQITAGSTR